MRVLEVGPWDFPAVGYIADSSVSEYVGVDYGVWEASVEGNRADEVFENALARNGLDGNKSRFFRMPVSAYSGGGEPFDIIHAANVFGDPFAIPKRQADGSIKFPDDEALQLSEALKRLLAVDGKVQIAETYTPIKRDFLIKAVERSGLVLTEMVEGSELMDFLGTVHGADWQNMQAKITAERRLKAAKTHGLTGCVDSPYLATFAAK